MPELLLLDTGVLIGRRARLDPDARVDVSALSLAELEFGLSASALRGDADEVRDRAHRLASIRAEFGSGLPFDGAAARAYGRVTHAVLRHGRSPRGRTVDLLIASIALASGASLITTQPDEFRGLQDLLEVRPA